jgi:hypothetical protein
MARDGDLLSSAPITERILAIRDRWHTKQQPNRGLHQGAHVVGRHRVEVNRVRVVIVLCPASTGAIIYLVVPQLWLAVSCCLLMLLLINSLVVFLATKAFVRFDISQDTPPA